MSRVLVIDTGTTNIKAGVVDEKGRILGFHRKKLTLKKDRKGKAEHSLSQLWESFLEVSRRAVEGFNSSIRLVVITGYQFGFLPIDRRGNPLMGMITLEEVVGILWKARRVEVDMEIAGKRCKVTGYRVKNLIRLDIQGLIE